MQKITMQNHVIQNDSPTKNVLRAAAALALTVVISGCGGGGSSHSSTTTTTNGNNSGTVQGIATPSNLSVVTAQNANAGS